jgi:integrase/recombinase XerD
VEKLTELLKVNKKFVGNRKAEKTLTERRLPKHVLSIKEAETVLAQPDLGTATGIRDRAMMETLYSTGMRRMELIGLHLHDVDADRGTVMIRQGKGKKDRMVPIGERALEWIAKYRDDVRPELAIGGDDGTLFLSYLGEAFTPNRLTQLVRDHVNAAKLGKTGACHLFRHTMATLMLENGADIRFIQAMLGPRQPEHHADLRPGQHPHAQGHPHRHPSGARDRRRPDRAGRCRRRHRARRLACHAGRRSSRRGITVERFVHLDFDLTPAQALALAQFLKRVGLDDYRRLAVDRDEAWTMLEAGERVRKALADAGYAPR